MTNGVFLCCISDAGGRKHKRLPSDQSGGGGGNSDYDEEELDLLYDPVLNCYYDPQTHKYYELL